MTTIQKQIYYKIKYKLNNIFLYIKNTKQKLHKTHPITNKIQYRFPRERDMKNNI